MITDISNEIADNRVGQRFTPQLWINNTNGVILNGGRIDGVESINKLNSDINLIKESSAQMALGVSSISDDNHLKIRYSTNVLQNLEGDYSVAIYIMEDMLLYTQSSAASNPFEHNYVIRTSNDDAFGTKLTSEDLTYGTEIEKELSFDVDQNWKINNLFATINVWKKVGDNYEVVNANNNKIY
ncbi:Omp28-related outer membrane protein [Bacteroidia bacterium]|nr:Omp28-related outer membrane protein [Bacteroidia bacterium]